MGRKERRAALKAQQIQNKADELWLAKQKHYGEARVINDALKEAEEIVTNHVSGEIYTLFALVLRQHPYRWSSAKIMRLFERVQSGIMMLNDKSYTTDQLISDAEAWGFKVKFEVDKKRKYIDSLFPFEEEAETE
jgi:hypothetical protein